MFRRNFELENRLRIEAEPLCKCPECKTDYVYPEEAKPVVKKGDPEAGTGLWAVNLRCGYCEWEDGGRFTQAQIDEFEEDLNRLEAVLKMEYEKAKVENWNEEKKLFEQDMGWVIQAINNGDIRPEDF